MSCIIWTRFCLNVYFVYNAAGFDTRNILAQIKYYTDTIIFLNKIITYTLLAFIWNRISLDHTWHMIRVIYKKNVNFTKRVWPTDLIEENEEMYKPEYKFKKLIATAGLRLSWLIENVSFQLNNSSINISPDPSRFCKRYTIHWVVITKIVKILIVFAAIQQTDFLKIKWRK